MPEPQENNKGLLPKDKFLKVSFSSFIGRNLPSLKRFVKGRLMDLGICPLFKCALGSETLPRKRSSLRASITVQLNVLILSRITSAFFNRVGSKSALKLPRG